MMTLTSKMDGPAIHTYREKELKNTIAVIGFPSIGLVSSIAASFLARELKLDPIAGLSSPDFPPYSIVQNGVPMPPIRIYAGDRECDDETGIDCDSLVVVTSEFMPKMEQHYPIAMTVLDWLSARNVKTVISMDGILQFASDEYVLLGAGSTPHAREMMKDYGIEEFEGGMIRGISGILLFEGYKRGLDVITLLGSARADMPDPRGAAKLMEPLGRMLPELKIDTEPLYLEAEELERRMKSQAVSEYPPELPRDQVLYG
jgi:uncharacterized protein